MATKKETAPAEVKEEVKEEIKEEKPAELDPNRKVKIKLFKDNNLYKDAVYVAVNGEDYLVPRGVDVDVPWYIAEVLENSMAEDQRTADQLHYLEQDYLTKG